jgi:hypothetical protein
MLLSTASSIADDKRKIALTQFLRKIRDEYNVQPRFNHVDKDFAEIAALQAVWPDAKRQICWWHLKRAINQRMSKAKLSTTPYNPADAKAQFAFIDSDFISTTAADPKEDEEYAFDAGEKLRKRKKKSKQTPSADPALTAPQAPDFLIKLPSLSAVRASQAVKRANGEIEEVEDEESSEDEDEDEDATQQPSMRMRMTWS